MIPWTAARQASLSITNSRSLLNLMSIELVMPSNHLILSSPSPPAFIFPSIRVFSNELVLPIRWPKCWSFSFSIIPSKEIPGLIFRMDYTQTNKQSLLLLFSQLGVSDSATPWTAARQASLSFTISWSLHKLISIESVIPSNHLILCHPLLLCPQSFSASGSFLMSQLFPSGGQSIGASASASVLPMNIQD